MNRAGIDDASAWAAFWSVSPDSKCVQVEARDFIERLSVAVPLDGSEIVLDFGCGFGHVARELAPSVQRIDVWDASPLALAAARRQVAGLSSARVDLTDPSADPTGEYDLVLVNSVVQYLTVPDLSTWLSRWRAMLRPAGRIVIADVPCGATSTPRETLGWIVFCARRHVLRSALAHGASSARRYRTASQQAPLLQLEWADLDRMAHAAGLALRPLPANLSHRPRRLSMVLVRADEPR